MSKVFCKKFIALLYCLAILGTFVFAGSYIRQPDPMYKFQGKNGKWGYFDENKKVVIPPQFENASDFYEGHAIIQTKDRLFVAINRYGKVITPVALSMIKDFSEGLAAFCLVTEESPYGKWGFINTRGEVVIQPVYDHVSSFNEGYAAYGIIKRDKTRAFGYINKLNKRIIPARYNYALEFSESLAGVQDENYKFGFINIFTKIIDFQFDIVGHFSEHVCVVGVIEPVKKK